MKKNSFLGITRDYAMYANIGLTLVVSILFWTGIGYWLDKKFHTSPYLLITGIVFSLISVFYEILKLAKMSEKKTQ
jgi:F0F1-type ATP synthase assembly protein I